MMSTKLTSLLTLFAFAAMLEITFFPFELSAFVAVFQLASKF
jgi:hypothetical protein